jgi:hypothetical protein
MESEGCDKGDSSQNCSYFIIRGRVNGLEIKSQWGARFSTSVQTGPGAHPASCTMGTGSFPGVEWLEREADPLPPSSAKV